MMATNMPEALDEALLRPGRIDRIYKVGYPRKAGRIRTYQGYFDKVPHVLTAEQIDKLATITPYATGATIKDLVNEALINAIREGRDVDHLARRGQGQAAQGARPARGRRVHRAGAARGRRARGLPRDRRVPDPPAHGDRPRHHREGQRLPRHGGEHPAGGPVHPLAVGVRVGHPRLARLAGRGADVLRRRHLLRACPATSSRRPRWPRSWRASGGWARPSRRTRPRSGCRSAAPAGRGRREGEKPEAMLRRALADRIEDKLGDLLARAEAILAENRAQVLALAHALETYRTLTGDDVEAVIEGREGDMVDGSRLPGPGVRGAAGGLPRRRCRRPPRAQPDAAGAAAGTLHSRTAAEGTGRKATSAAAAARHGAYPGPVETIEQWRGEDYQVRRITGSASTKPYRCPGCDQLDPAGHAARRRPGRSPTPRRRPPALARACWRARDRRGWRSSASRSAPRHWLGGRVRSHRQDRPDHRRLPRHRRGDRRRLRRRRRAGGAQQPRGRAAGEDRGRGRRRLVLPGDVTDEETARGVVAGAIDGARPARRRGQQRRRQRGRWCRSRSCASPAGPR